MEKYHYIKKTLLLAETKLPIFKPDSKCKFYYIFIGERHINKKKIVYLTWDCFIIFLIIINLCYIPLELAFQ